MPWVRALSNIVGRYSGAHAWAMAAAMFAASLAVRFLLEDWLPGVPFVIFFPAVIAGAVLCGWRCGAAILVASAAAAWFFFIAPFGSLEILGWTTLVPLLSFLAVGAFDIALVGMLTETIRRLERAADSQDAMTRELQHRVANNMQFVSSMLRLARRDIRDETARDVVDQAAARVTSMSHIQRRLHDPDAYTQGLEPVLRDVLDDLFEKLPVEVALDIPPQPLPLNKMTFVVMLVTEAATNAVKHVFRPEQGTRFDVSLAARPDGRMLLTVRDDGPGIGPVATATPAGQKLGMTIMNALARQLGGALQFESGDGTTIKVEFANS